MNKKASSIFKIAAVILLLIAAAILCVIFIPMIASLSEPENRQAFSNFIESLGILGVAVMFFLQVLQIVVAVIPGEPLELLMGLMYGTVPGFLLTITGIFAGQAIVFLLVKRFGITFAEKFVDVNKFRELSFIKNASRRDGLIFILFLIPGTPKDVLTYFVCFTGIPFLRFLVLATIARIPSVITSTLLGASIGDGDFLKSAVVFAVTGVLGIAGIIVNNKLTSKKDKPEI